MSLGGFQVINLSLRMNDNLQRSVCIQVIISRLQVMAMREFQEEN